MEFDFIKYRHNNNIFGRDLWYLTITGYGAYASLLNSSKNNPPNRIFYIENVDVSNIDEKMDINENVNEKVDITDEYVNTVNHITQDVPIPKSKQQKQIQKIGRSRSEGYASGGGEKINKNPQSFIQNTNTNNLPIPKERPKRQQKIGGGKIIKNSHQKYRVPPITLDEDDSKTTSTITEYDDNVNTSLMELVNKTKNTIYKQPKPTLSAQSQQLSLDALQQLNEQSMAMDATYEPELDVISDESDSDVTPEDLRAKSVVGQNLSITEKMKKFKELRDDIERKPIIFKNKKPDTVPTPLKTIVVGVKPNENPKSVTQKIYKNIANNWYDTLTKQKENKLSTKEQQELSNWDKHIERIHKIYGDPRIPAKEFIQRSKDALMRWKEQTSLKPRTTDWIDDEKQQSVTDIVQNTVSGTYHVANDLKSLKPRTSDWIDDEEQHSITDIAKNTGKMAVIGAAVGTVATTGAAVGTVGAVYGTFRAVGALAVVGRWLADIMTGIIANPTIVAAAAAGGLEAERTTIQNWIGLTGSVSDAILAQSSQERIQLTAKATANLIRHFKFGNYHHRVDTGNFADDTLANAYGNIKDISDTAVAMYEDPLSMSTVWKMWYTVTDNGITDAAVSAYNWYTGVNTYKIAGNMITQGVQEAIKELPDGANVPVQPQAIEFQQRKAIELPGHERSLPDLNLDSISQAYNDELLSAPGSLSGMTNVINNKGFDSNSLIDNVATNFATGAVNTIGAVSSTVGTMKNAYDTLNTFTQNILS